MADFEESDLYAAFGLEQPAVPEEGTPGGNDPEPAAPGEPAEQDTAPKDGGGEDNSPPAAEDEPPEAREGADSSGEGREAPPKADGGEDDRQTKEPQTAAQRAENAARRRREEQKAAIDAAVERAVKAERERTKGEMEAFFARAGLKNTVTGKPITTLEEFEAWKRDFDADKLQKDLKAGKLTQETLRTAVEQTPALLELKRMQEKQAAEEEARRQKAAREQVDREIAEIHKLDPAINAVEDLLAMENAKAFYDLVKKGNSFLDAYRLANFDRLTAAKAQAAKQQAMNNARGKNHLTGTGTPAGTGAATVPPEEMQMFHTFNPGASDAEITAWYNKHVKK